MNKKNIILAIIVILIIWIGFLVWSNRFSIVNTVFMGGKCTIDISVMMPPPSDEGKNFNSDFVNGQRTSFRNCVREGAPSLLRPFLF